MKVFIILSVVVLLFMIGSAQALKGMDNMHRRNKQEGQEDNKEKKDG